MRHFGQVYFSYRIIRLQGNCDFWGLDKIFAGPPFPRFRRRSGPFRQQYAFQEADGPFAAATHQPRSRRYRVRPQNNCETSRLSPGFPGFVPRFQTQEALIFDE
jgi:hypothetical protein